MKLYSNDVNQVSSFSYLVVELVDPSRKMHILSGIAIPAFDVDDDGTTHYATCEVDLGIALPDAQQAVAQVGLGSIVNDKSSFLFAVDNARVEIAGGTGRVLLFADLALKGSGSGLERFGFQVVVVSGVRSTGVTGRVLWDKSLFDATNAAEFQWRGLMSVNANIREEVDTGASFKTTKLVPIRSTGPQSLHEEGKDFWVPYAIDSLPLDTPLMINVDHLATVFPPFSGAGQINGPNVINLHPGHLSEAGIDFRITGPTAVR
jgi:hypothetical protein